MMQEPAGVRAGGFFVGSIPGALKTAGSPAGSAAGDGIVFGFHGLTPYEWLPRIAPYI